MTGDELILKKAGVLIFEGAEGVPRLKERMCRSLNYVNKKDFK
jgi:hypothetical protein